MKTTYLTATALISSLLLSACGDNKTETNVASSELNTNAQTATIHTDNWIGKWNGPEGTFLKISGGDGKYEIIISNLDGPKTYSGINQGREIQFEREGVKELIQATNGTQTGMKWLDDKKDCLTIHTGEGYCRD
jgi:hypothetical protein